MDGTSSAGPDVAGTPVESSPKTNKSIPRGLLYREFGFRQKCGRVSLEFQRAAEDRLVLKYYEELVCLHVLRCLLCLLVCVEISYESWGLRIVTIDFCYSLVNCQKYLDLHSLWFSAPMGMFEKLEFRITCFFLCNGTSRCICSSPLGMAVFLVDITIYSG
jgi:hypothetical protein